VGISGGGGDVGARKRGMKVYMVMHFVSIYENRRMKPVDIILRGGGGRENDGGVNPTKIYFKHM
jgi:hypothetical protein